MADLIRTSSLHRAPELITELGGDPVELFRRFGLRPSISEDRTGYIPFTLLTAFLGECHAELDVPDFGLRLAHKQGAQILGPLAVAIRHSETIEIALRNNIDYVQSYSPALRTDLVAGPLYTAYVVHTLLPDIPHRGHVAELALGIALTKFQMIAGRGFTPSGVSFRHGARFSEEQYVRHFGCAVEFNAADDMILFPTALLGRRVAQADRSAGALALEMVRMSAREPTFSQTVSARITSALPDGNPTVEQVAASLRMHPRTVQRRLAAAGDTFADLLDAVRQETAIPLLANPTIPVSEIAYRLGYSQQSAFTRSCRRWFGMPPSAKRAQLRESADIVGV